MWFTAGGAIRIAHYDVIDDVVTRKYLNTWHLVHQRAAHKDNDTGWTGHDGGCEINSSMDVGRREGVCN